MTVSELRRIVAARLRAAGIADARFEATQLLGFALGLEPAELPAKGNQPVTKRDEQKLERLLARREAGEPLQYILGRWEFFGLPFLVGSGVLIPRPDTELLCEKVILAAKELAAPKIAELCSGSGAVAVAAARSLPDASVDAYELSKTAFGYLNKNIALNQIENVRSVLADITKNGGIDVLYDIIAANPPYVREGDFAALSREVRREPKMALSGGRDGLTFYRKIAALWRKNLKPGGLLLLEIGAAQAAEVSAILRENGYSSIEISQDLSGLDRVVSARL